MYLVGDDTVFRYRWDGRALTRDDTWSFRYRTAPDQSYGWDPVLAGGHVWFLDNGEHTFAGSMLGQGVAVGPVHLVRVAIHDAADHELVEVSGRAGGAVTNPPVYDAARRIAVGYDSANGVLAAFDFVGSLRPRWQRDLATAGHLLLYPDAGVLMAYDHRAAGEDVVFVDVESGEERARVGDRQHDPERRLPGGRRRGRGLLRVVRLRGPHHVTSPAASPGSAGPGAPTRRSAHAAHPAASAATTASTT